MESIPEHFGLIPGAIAASALFVEKTTHPFVPKCFVLSLTDDICQCFMFGIFGNTYLYTVHTARTVHTVRTVRTVRTVHTYDLYILYILHILYILYIL